MENIYLDIGVWGVAPHARQFICPTCRKMMRLDVSRLQLRCQNNDCAASSEHKRDLTDVEALAIVRELNATASRLATAVGTRLEFTELGINEDEIQAEMQAERTLIERKRAEQREARRTA